MGQTKRVYYKHTLGEIRSSVKKSFPEANIDPDGIKTNKPGYILWMINEISKMDTTSKRSARKAARWLGWVLQMIEEDLGLWDNARSRDLVRKDVGERNDKAIK